MLKGGESDPRNKLLMKMFNLINIGERSGSGVPNIFNTWEDEGWKEPLIEERFDPDRTILTLEFIEKQAKKASEESKRRKQAKNESKRRKQAKKASEERKQAKKASEENKRRTKTSEESKRRKQAKIPSEANKQKNKRQKTNDNIAKIYEYLSQHGEAKTNDIADYIGLSAARVRVILSYMDNIESVGTNTNRKYKLK